MKRIYLLFLLICLCALFLTITNHFKNKPNIENTHTARPQYILIAENDTVNLYLGDKFIKNYDNIVTESLPKIDQDNIKSGIKLDSYDEVLAIIEDFDG